jgi:hypothetical protein
MNIPAISRTCQPAGHGETSRQEHFDPAGSAKRFNSSAAKEELEPERPLLCGLA